MRLCKLMLNTSKSASTVNENKFATIINGKLKNMSEFVRKGSGELRKPGKRPVAKVSLKLV